MVERFFKLFDDINRSIRGSAVDDAVIDVHAALARTDAIAVLIMPTLLKHAVIRLIFIYWTSLMDLTRLPLSAPLLSFSRDSARTMMIHTKTIKTPTTAMTRINES